MVYTMFLKIALLLAYFLLVFIGTRLVEFYVTSVAGWKNFDGVIPAIFEHHGEKSQENQDKTSVSAEEASDFNYKSFSEDTLESELDSQPGADGGVAANIGHNLQITNFNSYADFLENVKDTTNIWVVHINKAKRKNILNKKQWNWMCRRLQKFGIKVGTYKCSKDPRLCVHHDIYASTVMLALPRGSQQKGNIDYHIFKNEKYIQDEKKEYIYNWIKTKLYQKVKTVHSLSELTEKPVSRRKSVMSKPSMYFIYQSDKRVPPLLFTSLSVKFTGRIKFYMFKTKEEPKSGNVFAMNPSIMYNYGKKQGEYFTYSCVEFFLRTLHPEVNDIFVISVILLNMACWLELFLQRGGPLKRLFYYVWGLAIANIILVSIWIFIIQLLYMPQIQPILELCLKNFQQVMFTNIAAIIRQDIIQLSKHLHIVIFGFVGYGIILGFLHYKMRRDTERNSFTSVMDLIRYDIEELTELFYSLIGFITPSLRIYRFEESIERILHRLAAPDLWLHSKYPTDYVHDLPTWTHYCNEPDCPDHENVYSDDDIQSDVEAPFSDVEAPFSDVEAPFSDVEAPSSDVEVPSSDVEVPSSDVEVPSSDVEIPSSDAEVPSVDHPNRSEDIKKKWDSVSESKDETSLATKKNNSGGDIPNQLLTEDCVICLDQYKCGHIMRGLPCGHCFHKACIDGWLFPTNESSHHRCPVCRWPADIKKGKGNVEVIDLT